ncbi:40S ribosomal protein S13, partial [Durusdinium trenchii]
MLDDVGYGRREVKPRPVLPALQLADCMEEGFLQDAREAHQYVIALCCVLVLFITCAGSAIFSLKQPSVADLEKGIPPSAQPQQPTDPPLRGMEQKASVGTEKTRAFPFILASLMNRGDNT